MRRTASLLAAILLLALIGAPALAQPSPVDEVLGESEERPLPAAPGLAAPNIGGAGPGSAAGTSGLPRTGLDLTSGVALAGGLIVGGGLLLLLTRRRPADPA